MEESRKDIFKKMEKDMDMKYDDQYKCRLVTKSGCSIVNQRKNEWLGWENLEEEENH